MPLASFVPPTRDVELDEVDDALQRGSLGRLLADSFIRFRHADGFSHARSMAFQVVFAIIPGVILTVALATRLGEGRMQSMLRETITTITPGGAGDFLLRVFEQGASTAGRGNTIAIIFGGVAAVFAGTEAMAQLERGATRIYGVFTDRSPLEHWGLAGLLTLSVGVMLTAAFLLIVLGSPAVGALQGEVAQTWAWARWVLGVVLLVASLATVFKIGPNRDQPDFGWLALGGAIAGVLWLAVSLGLAAFLHASGTFGETYGPLAGFMALMIWAEFSAIAIFYGLAVAAQLEARRAGVDQPTIDLDQASTERGHRREDPEGRIPAGVPGGGSSEAEKRR